MKLGLNFIKFLKRRSSYVKTDEQNIVRCYFRPLKATYISCIGGKSEATNVFIYLFYFHISHLGTYHGNGKRHIQYTSNTYKLQL
jgi:hypothetical protein